MITGWFLEGLGAWGCGLLKVHNITYAGGLETALRYAFC